MTSTSTIRAEQPRFEGRTVRDVVEYQHELVNEVWCRKIFRQVLQSLELQYQAGMPHRAITPDTIAFQENGEPLLLPSERKASETGIPADLHALACVIHYAITLELLPQGPLRGRALEGYSDSLIGAVDQCLSPDPATRPRTIEELRNLLGIVSLGSPPAATPAPAASLAPETVSSAQPLPGAALTGKLQRWLLIGLAALVLLAAAMALVALLRGTASHDAVVLTLPPQGGTSGAGAALATRQPTEGSGDMQTTAPSLPAPQQEPAPAALPQAPYQRAAPPPPPVPLAAAAQEKPAAARQAQPEPRAARVPAAPPTTYKLMIKPWGTVYVDGDERGVSPPLKRLTLPAGRHTVRIVNPNFRDRVFTIDAGRGAYGAIDHDFTR